MKILLFLTILILIPINVQAQTEEQITVTLGPDRLTAWDRAWVTIHDESTDFDPNKHDTIEVLIIVKVKQASIGTKLGFIPVDETGPDTRTFQAFVPVMTPENLYNEAAGQDNQILEVGYASEGAYTYATAELYRDENTPLVLDDTEENGGGCLIATVTYGTELAPQVQQLRELRDNTLLQTSSGTAFMTSFNQIYYSFSPGIADLERKNLVFREAVKLTITPMISTLSLLNHVEINSNTEMLSYGISLIILNVGMYFVAPAIVIISLKKKLNY